MPVVGIDFIAKTQGAIDEVNRLTGATKGALATAQREAIKVLGEQERATIKLARAQGLLTGGVRGAGVQAGTTARQARDLAAGAGAAAGATEELGGVSNRTAAGLLNLSHQIQDVGVSLAGGQSPFTVVIQQAPQIVQAFGEIDDAIGVVRAGFVAIAPFAASIGIVTAAVAAGAAVWWHFASAAEEAAEKVDAATASADSARSAYDKLNATIRHVDDAYGLLQGTTTKGAIAQRDALEDVNKSFQVALGHNQAQLRAAKERLAVAEKTAEADRRAVGDPSRPSLYGQLYPTLVGENHRTVMEARADVARYSEEIGRLGSEQAVAASKAMSVGAAEDDLSSKRKGSTDATKSAREAEEALRRSRELAAAQAELAAENERKYAGALSGLRSIRDAARHDGDDELAQIEELAQTRLAAALEERRISIESRGPWQEKLDAMEEFTGAVEAIKDAQIRAEDEYYAAVDAKREADLSKAKSAADAKRRAEMQAVQSTIGYVGQAAGAIQGLTQGAADRAIAGVQALEKYEAESAEYLTAHQSAQLGERVAAQKQAATRAFEVNQAAAIAGAVVNTASAFVAALDDAPYPFNLVLAGLSAAAGAGQIATIASQRPAFHSGGVVTADLLPGEAVLNRRATERTGPAAVDRANAGVGSGSSPVVVEYHHRHRVIDVSMSAALRRGGRARADVRGLMVNPGYRS